MQKYAADGGLQRPQIWALGTMVSFRRGSANTIGPWASKWKYKCAGNKGQQLTKQQMQCAADGFGKDSQAA